MFDTEATPGTISLTQIIEAAMETFQLHDKDSSKLSQVWLACDENRQISMPDVLKAAVTDMMNLQSLLVAAERKITNYEAAAVPPTNDDILLARIDDLLLELKEANQKVSQYDNQKQRMIENLKKKKARIDALEEKLGSCEKELRNLSTENGTLRQNLQAVTDTRDSCKNKFRSQQESVKESRTIIQDLEKRLRKTEQARAVEGELLDQFRKLAIHTG